MQKNKLWLKIIVIILLFHANLSFAWNSYGHKLIAQIAYQNLTADALELFTKTSKGKKAVNPEIVFINSAPWLDKLRGPKFKKLHRLHYINLAYTPDNSLVLPPSVPNAVTAIVYATKILSSDAASTRDKNFNFKVLLHVVGDIHQPLHATSIYSKDFPRGDLGGNLIALAPNPVAKSLHSFWDAGGGLLKVKRKLRAKDVKQKAREISARWPCDMNSEILDPIIWAQESHEIGVNFAHPYTPNTRPSTSYQQKTKNISEERIALAGCRLAKLLNKIAN